VAAVVILLGVFCVAVGWHWKLMHRSWQDMRLAKEQAKGRIPILKEARSHHTSVGIVFAVIVAVLIVAVVH
jgi:hypothetical protein